ncbi:MAG: NUDIX domain-containing protein [Candidatus Paceibacterota bacterium]
MEYLKNQQEQEAIKWMREAANSAERALCLNAKCGAVIVKDDEIIGSGYNAPPLDKEENRMCGKEIINDKPNYDKTCCVHAEWRAITSALKNDPTKIKGAKLYFARINDQGEIIKSGQPYCTVCSRLALDAGIDKFVLWHAAGIGEYGADEYNQLSYAYVSEKKQRFKITPAVYLVLFKGDKVLLMRRQNTDFHPGDYGLPSGHLEGDETLVQAMIREAKEEIGTTFNPTEIKLAHAMHRKMPTEERVSFFFTVDNWEGEPKIMEPHKCDNMNWFEINDLPENIIPYIRQAIINVKEKNPYSEDGWQ